MTDDNNDPEPKIIVDEDWKSQVQQEKEQLQEEFSQEKTAEPENQQSLPPASFEMLVTTLSTQALASFGYIPDPTTGEASQNKPLAKHFIDTLGVLEEKTKGNLTPDEANLIKETLHQLRMAFIQLPSPDSEKTQTEPTESSSSIELP